MKEELIFSSDLASSCNPMGSVFIFLLHAHDSIAKNKVIPIKERIDSCEIIWRIVSKLNHVNPSQKGEMFQTAIKNLSS